MVIRGVDPNTRWGASPLSVARTLAGGIALLVLLGVVLHTPDSAGKKLVRNTPAAPQTTKKLMWGSGNLVLADGTSEIATMRNLGVGIFGIAVRWALIAPERPRNPTDPKDPAYVWPAFLTQSIKQAERHGMQSE